MVNKIEYVLFMNFVRMQNQPEVGKLFSLQMHTSFYTSNQNSAILSNSTLKW